MDEEGNVYALLKEKVAYFKPSSYPPTEGTTYGTAVTVAKESEFGTAINALSTDPANGHLLANGATKTIEYGSAKEGSKPIGEVGASLNLGIREGVATCANSGDLYIPSGGGIFVLNEAGTEILTQITGVGSPTGSFGANAGAIAVDQSNCHVIVFETHHENVQEYESSGTYIAAFGSATPLVTTAYGVAVDNGALQPQQRRRLPGLRRHGARDLRPERVRGVGVSGRQNPSLNSSSPSKRPAPARATSPALRRESPAEKPAAPNSKKAPKSPSLPPMPKDRNSKAGLAATANLKASAR